MPYLDPESIIEAKRMDLFTWLKNYDPQELVHFSGNVYCTRTHDSLEISNGKWFWDSQGIGGRSALDYLIKVRGIPFLEAVEKILGRTATVEPLEPFFASAEKVPLNKAPFILPKQDCSQSMLERYLRKRGISYDVIHYFMDCGLLYQTHCRGHYNLVFVGRDPQNIPRSASIRGINSTFKGEVAGGDKRYPFSCCFSDNNKCVHVFESAIDLMSFMTLKDFRRAGYFKGNLLSLSGVFMPNQKIEDSSLPPALEQHLIDYPKVNHIRLYLDNDVAGRSATEAITAILTRQKKYTVISKPSPTGKDYNEHLCNLLMRTKSAQSR